MPQKFSDYLLFNPVHSKAILNLSRFTVAFAIILVGVQTSFAQSSNPDISHISNQQPSEEMANPLKNFNLGIQFYQDSQFEQAKDSFEAALKIQPENPIFNYNLALAEWKLGHRGPSLGLLRRAQHLDPSFTEARIAEKHLHNQLKVKELPHKIGVWEDARRFILKPLSLSSIACAGLILFFAFGYTLPKFLAGHAKFRKEKQSESPSPFPVIFVGLLLSFLVTIFVLKIYDLSETRGTVLPAKIEVRSGPTLDSATIFDLFEGLEVIVRRSLIDSNQKEWHQVSYPGGMSGWVSSDQVMLHSTRIF